jgi:hypothetical protein
MHKKEIANVDEFKTTMLSDAVVGYSLVAGADMVCLMMNMLACTESNETTVVDLQWWTQTERRRSAH